jgi:hypothetical protein
MARSVLYYPFMDIPDTGWLRNALLHWDNLYTLVPEGLDVPYRSRETRLLADEGIVRRLWIDEYGAQPAYGMLLKAVEQDSRWRNELLTAERVLDNEPPQADWHEAPYFIIHPNKFPSDLLDLILEESGGTKALHLLLELNSVVNMLGRDNELSQELGQRRLRNIVRAGGLPVLEKPDLATAIRLRDEVKRALQHRLGPRMGNDFRYWVRVSRPTAQLYMGALAATAADRKGLAVATDAPGISAWADAACLTALISRGHGFTMGPLPRLGLRIDPRSGDPDVAPSAMGVPTGILRRKSRALLARLTAETLSVAPDTSIRKIVDFRQRYRDEFDRYLGALDQLSERLASGDYPSLTALEQHVVDMFRNEVRPALGELQKAQRGAAIAAGPELIRAGTFVLPPSVAALLTGHPALAVAVGGAGITISLGAALWKSWETWRGAIRGQQYAFLLRAKQKLESRL